MVAINREYVPAGWLKPPVIPSSLVRISCEATLWNFSVIVSRIHMSWLSHIGGKLKSDPRYSIGLVYNTFPWPDATAEQREHIEALAQDVLDARAAWPTRSEEHTSELQSLMRISYAGFCLK